MAGLHSCIAPLYWFGFRFYIWLFFADIQDVEILAFYKYITDVK